MGSWSPNSNVDAHTETGKVNLLWAMMHMKSQHHFSFLKIIVRPLKTIVMVQTLSERRSSILLFSFSFLHFQCSKLETCWESTYKNRLMLIIVKMKHQITIVVLQIHRKVNLFFRSEKWIRHLKSITEMWTFFSKKKSSSQHWILKNCLHMKYFVSSIYCRKQKILHRARFVYIQILMR